MEEAEEMVLSTGAELWNNDKVWKTGPLLVTEHISRALFTALEEAGSRRLEYKFDEAQPETGQLYYLGEGTALHGATVQWFVWGILKQLEKMGVVKEYLPRGVPPRVFGPGGGLVDFPGRIRNFDYAIYERLHGHPARDALTTLVVEASDTNKSEAAVLEFLEHACDAFGSNTKIGIGIFYRSRRSEDFNFDVFVKRTGKKMETCHVDKNTEKLTLEIPIKEIFRSRRLLKEAPRGSKLILDFCTLRDEVEWALNPLTPAQRRELL